jgi:splicing factor 1
MESESGAKIAIRGKGSVKEGKGRSDAAHTSNQEEDLHCLIMADTEEKVNKAKKLIHNVIETAASIPEGQNELKRNQLRELAALNGTLRDDENQACQNCKYLTFLTLNTLILTNASGGQIGHRKYDCPEQRNFTANIICRVCGNAGHMARDCPDRQRGTDMRNNVPGGFNGPQRRIGGGDAVDREMEVCIYLPDFQRNKTDFLQNLMQELSGNPSGNGEAGRIEAGPGMYEQGDSYGGKQDLKPWQRQPTNATAPWQRERVDRGDRDRDGYGAREPTGSAPPWAQHNRGGDSYGGGYGGAPGSNVTPWQHQAPPGGPGYGYGGYPGGGYGDLSAGGYGAPPPPAPPGLSSFLQQYSSAPPPPPGDAPPPPPPSGDTLPPPPPSHDYPPPPPPA